MINEIKFEDRIDNADIFQILEKQPNGLACEDSFNVERSVINVYEHLLKSFNGVS